MKVAIVCRSLLLSQALELFLKGKIVSRQACDFIISDEQQNDHKPSFYIASSGGHLAPPFTKSALMIALEKFYHETFKKSSKELENTPSSTHEIPEILEEKIVALTERFRQELIETLKEHCGN